MIIFFTVQLLNDILSYDTDEEYLKLLEINKDPEISQNSLMSLILA